MAINVEYSSGAISTAPAGQFQAVCAEVVDLGYSTKIYRNKEGIDEPKTVHEIQYIFQLNKADPNTGKRYTVRSKPFNLVLSDKANLRAFLLQWRGHDLTDAEKTSPGLDVDLTGHNCLIQVIHQQDGDKTYANIGSIMPLLDGVQPIEIENYEPQGEAILRRIREKQNQPSSYDQAMPHVTGTNPPPTHTGGSAPAAAPAQAVSTNGNDDIPF